MDYKNIKFFMASCMFFQDWNSYKYISNFEKRIEKNELFNIQNLKIELQKAFQNNDLDWVNLAIETNFVYTLSRARPLPFNVDELLIFTGAANWNSNSHDAQLSFEEKENLKSQFRESYLHDYKDIRELISDSKYSWLPFEIKHSFLLTFSPIEYTNEDIIYYLKSLVWDYLYPNQINLERLNALKEESCSILEKEKSNQGWMEIVSIKNILENFYTNLDLYELSKIKWDKTIQHKIHYKNPFTLGFIRITPKKE